MSGSKTFFLRYLLLTTIFLTISLSASERVGKHGLATPITPKQYKAWDISIMPDGRGLPQGSGDHKTGKKLFEQQCAACHGEAGTGGIRLDPYRAPIATLVDHNNSIEHSLTSGSPRKTIGSYWQYSTTLFDYIRRTMPFQDPKSLSDDEVYALCAYLLAENEIIAKDKVLDNTNLAKVRMPNVDGLICDNRVDTMSLACMHDCPLPNEKSFNVGVVIDDTDHLESDCLVQPGLFR